MAPKMGCLPQTLNEWGKRSEVGAVMCADVMPSDARRMIVIRTLGISLKHVQRNTEVADAIFLRCWKHAGSNIDLN